MPTGRMLRQKLWSEKPKRPWFWWEALPSLPGSEGMPFLALPGGLWSWLSLRAMCIYNWPCVLVGSGHHKPGLNNRLISHTSGGWEVQGQGAGKFSSWRGPSY